MPPAGLSMIREDCPPRESSITIQLHGEKIFLFLLTNTIDWRAERAHNQTVGSIDFICVCPLDPMSNLHEMMNDAVSRNHAARENFLPKTGDSNDHHHGTGVDPFRIGELAHELRQPLSTIESLAYYLELTSESDHIRRQLERIRLMVDRANQILAQASVA